MMAFPCERTKWMVSAEEEIGCLQSRGATVTFLIIQFRCVPPT